MGTQSPQVLCVAAWVWFSLTTEFVEPEVLHRCSRINAAQPHENESRIPPGEPSIRHRKVHIHWALYSQMVRKF